jgi:Putative esterase
MNRWAGRAGRCLVVGWLAFCLSGCGLMLREPGVPMDTLTLPFSPAARSQTLIVFMPGAQEMPGDIVREGFVDQVRTRGIDADVVVADAHLGYFYSGSFEQRLHEDVIRPARAQGYRSIWVAGISLGGFGAMRYARAHPEAVNGVIALAPYVAPRLVLQDVWHAGGLLRWTPEGAPRPIEHDLLLWLKGYADPAQTRPPLYMGYGERDRLQPFLPPLMAGILPPERLLSAPGDHDWPPWKAMWADALDRAPLPRQSPLPAR